MRVVALSLMLLVWGIALPATIYKWVDENGVTHYSDQPHPGAQKLEVHSAQTYSAPPSATPVRPAASRSGSEPADAGAMYGACELYRPANDEVFFNVSAVSAKLRLDPQLRPGHKITVALDGRRLPDVPVAADGEFTVAPVYRGTHVILAVVEDSAGQTICQTPGVTFHVRQASTLSPQSPTRPPTSPPRAPSPPARP